MRKALTSLVDLLASIEVVDPLDVPTFETLERVRAKMRMVDAWLTGSRPARRTPDADAAPVADLSF